MGTNYLLSFLLKLAEQVTRVLSEDFQADNIMHEKTNENWKRTCK